MIDPLLAVAELVKQAARDAYQVEGVDPQIRRSQHADLQADLALGLARRLKQPPRAVAERLVSAIAANDVIERIEIAGPGFLNVTLKNAWLASAVERVRSDERLGVPLAEKPDRVVIDYSAPNVAKEMHVGHVRTTVIGDCLARLLAWRGHTILRQNHIGDWGTPFGMLIEHLLEAGASSEADVSDLTAFYKAARKKFDEDPAFAERARLRVVSLQSGDAPTLELWRRLVDLSIRHFDAIYAKLGVTLTQADVRGESFYNDRLAPLAQELEQGERATISDGALCLFPPGFKNKEGEPLPLIVRKRDGGFGYATTDLAAIRYRVTELDATRLLYVVGAPQAQHLAMIFAAARELGWLAPPRRAEHVAFGSVLGPDKKMLKSRTGEAVRLAELVDGAVARAAAVIAEKAPDLPAESAAEVARQVGVGAIKYADLSTDRVKDYIFDLDRMVSFDGNTAGYMQYAHARIRSILRKSEDAPGSIRIAEPAERALALELLGFGAAVCSVEETLEPHRLASYVYALATAFTRFYQECPILKAEPDVRASRLALADAAANTIARALGLLGIDAPERM
jgi:arginyl-tRNA synthetase